jgi:Domain of unknown function (DUF4864)
MRRQGLMLLTLVFALNAADGAAGQGSASTQAATNTVLEQLAAFRRDDFDAAYGFASTTIKQMFDRASFEIMVRGGYPEIARSQSASITDFRLAPTGSAYLILLIVGGSGRSIEAIYELVWEDGAWKINGVVTRPAPNAVDARLERGLDFRSLSRLAESSSLAEAQLAYRPPSR